MPAVSACPPPSDYQRLIYGVLPPSEVERLSQHLTGCSSCAAAVQTLLGEDTLLSAVRGAPADALVGEDVPSDLTQRLLALRSAPDLSSDSSLTLRALSPAQQPDEIGRLAHYRVLKVLGEGGMGVVFLAEDVRLARTVALKTMKPEIAADPRNRQRFDREARAAAKVEDDHIVPIYDVGDDRGVLWLAMPFLKGQSLDEMLKRLKVLKPAQAVRLGAQVARGLAAAHAAGLIHRDVKPANIWVEPEGGGRAKLLDFGLARDQRPAPDQGQEHLTRSGAVVGTPAFMAPEQARGEPLDARADLFSLGCVLYRAVTGRLPFQGHGPMATLLALATETPPAPHELNAEVPQPLSALIMNLLAKDRSARPRSAAVVAEALRALQETPASTLPLANPVALPAERREEPNPWADLTEVADQPAPVVVPRRRWRVATAAAVLLLALGGALAAGVVIIIKNSKGEVVAQLTARDGDKLTVEVKEDKLGAGRPQEAPRDANADRRAADWVLSVGGKIRIRQDEQERDAEAKKDVPTAPFQVVGVELDNKQEVDDSGLEHLRGLTSLTHLHLHQTRVSDAGLSHLKGLTNLTHLVLYPRDRALVSDAGLAHLKQLNNLSALILQGTRVSDDGLAYLKGFTNLEQLGLSNSPQVSDAGLVHVAGLSKLKVLWLNQTQVSDSGLVHLKRLTGLTYLNLSATQVSDVGLVHLKGLTNLTQFALNQTQVSDDGLEQLKGMTMLSLLGLRGTRARDAGLKHLAGLSNLTQLDLTETEVTANGVAALQKALPKCKIVSGPVGK
jgi:serine/threonine protein kinase